ncbi:hypothetical protein DWY37_04010 [Roseburia sp. AF25-13LB]|nr:hypothetical protein DWY49_07475 [Roseburia sp. AF25-25LB]RHQ42845.1 hypothetical protein DWY43_05425 [Roseburia sp. AF25-18LB]RHQ50957.1 hypothetical protein DWY37_04010 [Roseburia sp. AF25-13LB]
MDVPARRNGAWMRLFAVCQKKDILPGNPRASYSQRRYFRTSRSPYQKMIHLNNSAADWGHHLRSLYKINAKETNV